MSALSPTEIKSLCKKYGLTPSKKYGQNYLISQGTINKMISVGDFDKNDTVVEIGPGFGILTFALAPLVKKVIAFEIERKIKPYWDEKTKEFPNIEIVWGNALHKIQNSEFRIQNYKVVANLPYQITSHALRTLFELNNKPESIIVMVQKEVADRICAKSGDMSILSVSVQYYGTAKIIAKVPKGNFWPQPKVDSSILSIKTFKHLGIKTSGDEDFFKIVRAGFANKRKQLWRNLSNNLDFPKEEVKKAITLAVGNEKIRAQELSVEQWKKLCECLIT